MHLQQRWTKMAVERFHARSTFSQSLTVLVRRVKIGLTRVWCRSIRISRSRYDISYCYWNCCCVYISRRMVNCIVSDLGRVHLSVSVEHVRWRGREARGKNDNGILRVTAPTVLSGFQDSFNADSLLNLQWRSSWRSHHNGSNTVYITHRELSLASRQRCAR